MFTRMGWTEGQTTLCLLPTWRHKSLSYSSFRVKIGTCSWPMKTKEHSYLSRCCRKGRMALEDAVKKGARKQQHVLLNLADIVNYKGS